MPVLFPSIAYYLHTPSLSSVLRQQHNSLHMYCVHPLNLIGITQHATRERVRTIFVYRHVSEAVRPETETYGSTADSMRQERITVEKCENIAAKLTVE